jgi:hypothetical protein
LRIQSTEYIFVFLTIFFFILIVISMMQRYEIILNLPKKLVEINKNNFWGESRIAPTPCDKNQ